MPRCAACGPTESGNEKQGTQRKNPHGPRHRRVIAPAVRRHGAVPLPVRAVDARTLDHHRHHGDGLRHDRPRDLARHDEVLGRALRHQLRDGRRHRHRDGVPVRHELELLQPLRRRHLRRAAGHRGADGLLHGGHLRRPVLLRLGQALQGRPPDRHLGRGHRLQFLGAVDPHRQRLDAEPRGRGLQSADHAHGSDRLRRRADQPGRAGQVRPYRVGRLCVRRGVRARRLRGTCSRGVTSNSPSAR